MNHFVLAGVEGFEPSNVGVRDPCLTTWRHPNVCSIIIPLIEFGWGSWIRTNEMIESKSIALPLGYTPILINFVGWKMGLEPTTSRSTILRSNQLRYIHHKSLVSLERFELPTLALEGRCSIQLS